jgi:hypothetical protein
MWDGSACGEGPGPSSVLDSLDGKAGKALVPSEAGAMRRVEAPIRGRSGPVSSLLKPLRADEWHEAARNRARDGRALRASDDDLEALTLRPADRDD